MMRFKAEFLPKLSIFCRRNELFHPFALNFHRVFPEKFDLVDPLFYEPRKNGIERHATI